MKLFNKRMLSVLMSALLSFFLPIGMLSAYTSGECEDCHEHNYSSPLQNQQIFDVYYTLDGKNIVETTTLKNESLTKQSFHAVRTIFPNNTAAVSTTDDIGRSSVSQISDISYDYFYNLYEFTNGLTPRLRGSDITGSQYKHVYVGSPGSSTIYKSGWSGFGVSSATSLATYLLSVSPLPSLLISLVSSFLWNLIEINSPYKLVISSTTYEIRFSYDNNYYCHCYHTVAKGYNSSGNLLFSRTDYNQAIGG